jgi:hypothetical protein
MSKRRTIVTVGTALLLLLVTLGGATYAFAQEDPSTPPGQHEWNGEMRSVKAEVAAEALGMTPEQLLAELDAGNSLADIAEAQGVELEAVREVVHDAVRAAGGGRGGCGRGSHSE